VPVHDLIVHPRDAELVVGTHGRSIYTGRVKELQQLTSEKRNEPLLVFEMDKVRYSSRWGAVNWWNAEGPKAAVPMYVSEAGMVKITVSTEGGLVLRQWEYKASKGLNYPVYDLQVDDKILPEYNAALNEKRKSDEKPIMVKAAENGKPYIYKGMYQIMVEMGDKNAKTKLVVE
jgi:hypothetical protein